MTIPLCTKCYSPYGNMACDIVANTSEAPWHDKAQWPATLPVIRQRSEAPWHDDGPTHEVQPAIWQYGRDVVPNTSEAQWHDKALWPATLLRIRQRHHGMTMALRTKCYSPHDAMACVIVANTSEALWHDKALWPATLSLIRQRHMRDDGPSHTVLHAIWHNGLRHCRKNARGAVT